MTNTRSGSVSSPAAPASKKRGATDSGEGTSAKKRGRPKKELASEKVETADPVEDEAEVVEESTPVKRGRGRPKKELASEKAETADPVEDAAEVVEESTPVKRGRGRPKKELASEKAETTDPVKDEAEVVEESTPVKRGRGRPKKDATPKMPAAKKAGRPKNQTVIEDSMDIDSKEENSEEAGEDVLNGTEKKGDGDKVGEEDTNDSKEGDSDKEKGVGSNQDDENLAIDEVIKNTDSIEDDSEVAGQIKDNVKKPEEAKSESKEGEKKDFDEVKADASEVKKDVEEEQEIKAEAIAENNESVIEDPKREAAIPSSILEKGIVYFFYRPRVNIEDPQGIEDIARSFIVLRPIPLGAKLGDGPLEDSEKARLLALPKKMVPKSKQDKFLMFTDKVGMSIKDIRDEFAGNEYATKTSGISNSPAATPFAEGVYVITSTDGASHLAYLLTKPSPLGDIQKELGLHEKGSFILSAKNPEARGSATVSIDNPAEYPEEIQKQFRGRGWMPLVPELLDFVGTQFLIIGEGLGEFSNAVKEMGKDKKDVEKEKPEEELEKLEEEDHDRVSNLKEDDPVFADLGLSSKEYSKIETTW